MKDIQGFHMDSYSQLYGVIGDPIRHSKSPVMLNSAFQAAGINAVYGAFHVKPEQLGEAIAGVRALGFGGLNVTIPHKVHVMDYLDDMDESARMIEAVNTIVHRDGKLIGYNTDGIGYVRSLKEEMQLDLRGKRLLVIGAGGAARGVVYALAKEQPEMIWIVNRTKDKADALARHMQALCNAEGMGLEGIDHIKSQVDIVINTTSVGMSPHVNEVPIDTSWFHKDLIVSDLIYNPRITRILQEAKHCGASIHGGLGMFIYQGAFAFEYWTGQSAPVNVMRTAVETALSEENRG